MTPRVARQAQARESLNALSLDGAAKEITGNPNTTFTDLSDSQQRAAKSLIGSRMRAINFVIQYRTIHTGIVAKYRDEAYKRNG